MLAPTVLQNMYARAWQLESLEKLNLVLKALKGIDVRVADEASFSWDTDEILANVVRVEEEREEVLEESSKRPSKGHNIYGKT